MTDSHKEKRFLLPVKEVYVFPRYNVMKALFIVLIMGMLRFRNI